MKRRQTASPEETVPSPTRRVLPLTRRTVAVIAGSSMTLISSGAAGAVVAASHNKAVYAKTHSTAETSRFANSRALALARDIFALHANLPIGMPVTERGPNYGNFTNKGKAVGVNFSVNSPQGSNAANGVQYSFATELQKGPNGRLEFTPQSSIEVSVVTTQNGQPTYSYLYDFLLQRTVIDLGDAVPDEYDLQVIYPGFAQDKFEYSTDIVAEQQSLPVGPGHLMTDRTVEAFTNQAISIVTDARDAVPAVNSYLPPEFNR